MRVSVLLMTVCLATAVASAAVASPAVGSAAAIGPTTAAVRPGGVHGAVGREGGEDFETAFPIPSIPFFDTGNTCGHIFNYDVMCPFGAWAPDVVYSYVPPRDMTVTVSLCNSYYDTKLQIYKDAYGPQHLVACNDDYFECEDPPVMYTSLIEDVSLFPGGTYYIVVSGYTSACGDYVLEITECDLECPPGAVEEGEEPCHDGYVDQFNGGCGSDPVIFSELGPSGEPIVVCGEGGNFDGNLSRDTDWYMLHPNCLETTVTACITAEFDVIMGFIDFREGCYGVGGLDSYVQATACEPAYLTDTLPLGHWILWISTDDWSNVPCGSDYTLTIEGYELCTGVDDSRPSFIEASWGTIKGLYR